MKNWDNDKHEEVLERSRQKKFDVYKYALQQGKTTPRTEKRAYNFNPCPFCGCKSVAIDVVSITEDIIINTSHYKVEVFCIDCKTRKPISFNADTNEEALKQIEENWNRRTNPNGKNS